MSNIDIIRAGKDEDDRNHLSAEQRSQLPKNPIQLSDEEMEAVSGGFAFGPWIPRDFIAFMFITPKS